MERTGKKERTGRCMTHAPSPVFSWNTCQCPEKIAHGRPGSLVGEN